MSIALVQTSASEASGTSSAAATLPAAATAGNTLVAYVVTKSGTATGGPAGWTKAAEVSNGTTETAAIWVLSGNNNAGGGSSFSFTGSGGVKAWADELSGVDPANPVRTTGTNTSSATTCALTAGAANKAGDAAFACFGIEFGTSTSGTWTLPSGWTLAGSDQGSAAQHLDAIRQLGLAAGTLSVTGQFSVTGTFAGALVVLAPKMIDVAQTVTVTRTADITHLGKPYTIVSGSGGASNTLQVTVSANSAAGDTLVVAASSNSNGQTVTGITDSQGNVYTPAKSDYNQSDGQAVFWSDTAHALVSGTDWIKATFSGSAGGHTLIGRGCTGVNPGSLDIAIADDASSGTSPTSGASGALASEAEWALAFLVNGNGGGTPSAWTGGFTAQTTANNASNQYQTVADQIVSSTASLTAGATITSTKWAMILVTFQAKGSAALKADVSDTVTVSRTAGTRLAAVAGVSDTVSATVTASITASGPTSGLGTPYTLVSGTGAPNLSNTLQVTVEASTATGDAFVVGAGSDGSGVTVTGVTDSQGNAYTLAKSDYNQSDGLAVYVALNAKKLVSGVDWIKATFSGTAGAKTLNGRGCSGIATSGAVDVAIAADAASGTAMSVGPSAALAQGSEWAVAFSTNGNGGGQPTSWTGGFTAADTAHYSNNQYQTVADQVVTSTAALTAGATITSSKWAMVLVTLKAGGGTQYLIDVSDTVTATITPGTRLAAVAKVADTITATVTANFPNGWKIDVSKTFTANRTVNINKNALPIDVSKTFTATVTDNARRGRPISVSQSITMPVTTGTYLAAVAAVNDILTAAITAGPPNLGRLIDSGLTVTASEATSTSMGAVQVLAQWTQSAVNSYGVTTLRVNNTPGACLAAFVGWSADDATRNPIVYVSDDAHNYWVPLEVSDPNSLQRGAIWVCTNAQVGDPQTGMTTVTVSSTLPTAGIAFNIVELSNMPPFVALSGLESSAHGNAVSGLSASGNASGPAWGMALYVSDGPVSAEPGSPWGSLATGSTFNPGQSGGGQLDVASSVTATVTANLAKNSTGGVGKQIDVSKVLIVSVTADTVASTPTGGGGIPAVLYAGANTGPQAGPTLANFTNALTGANGSPDLGPVNCYKFFYSSGGSGIYTGSLPSTWKGSLQDQITQAQPGLFGYISWGVLESQSAISQFVSTIPSTDLNGNQMVVGFTFQSEPENAYPATAAGGAQFVSDWIDQAKKIRVAQSLTGAKLVLILSTYMPAYATDGNNSAAMAGDFIPPAVSGGVTVTDVWGADFYQHELASNSSWSTAGMANSTRWLNWVAQVKAKSGISNPQFALTEYGIAYNLANVGTQANGNNIRNQRFQADLAYVQSAFGPGGSVSPRPLWNWLFWETSPTNQYYVSDGPGVSIINGIINDATNRGVNGQ